MDKILKIIEEANKFYTFDKTCSIDNPKDFSFVFVNSIKNLSKLPSEKHFAILFPQEKTKDLLDCLINNNCKDQLNNPYNYCCQWGRKSILFPVEDINRVFVLLHNHINVFNDPERIYISDWSNISPDARIAKEGMKYVKDDDKIVRMKHMGNVIIEYGVEIGEFSSIARATLDSTIIKKQVKIGRNVYIGHNVFVDENTIIVDGVIIGGSAQIGKRCFIGLNSTIRNQIKICDDVLIGQASNVVKNITKPGTYAGNPAKRIGDWNGEW